MKKYNNYKDSDIEWIGEIPEHWEIKRGKYLFKIVSGYSPENVEGLISKSGIPYFKVNDLNDKSEIFNLEKSNLYISDNFLNKSPKETILFPKRGAAISTNKVKISISDCVFDTNIMGLIPFNEKIHSRYLAYSLLNRGLWDIADTSTIPQINNKHIEPLEFVLPETIDEQKKIVEFIDLKTTQIDALIFKKQQFITLLEEERIAVINHAVTKGLDPKVKMKDSGIEWLGEIPEHWEVKRLKYLCKIINEKTSQKPDYVLALENIKSWTGEIVGNPLDNKMEGDVNLFQENDILFNKLRPYLAKVIKTQSNGGCVGELLVLRANYFITPTFLYFRMISEAIITIVDNSTYGTKMPRASWDKFISLIEIGFPTIDEQNKITDYIENKIREIETLTSKTQQEIELLKEYKTALISEVVTGKVDVRDINLN